jgi:adenylate cyclase
MRRNPRHSWLLIGGLATVSAHALAVAVQRYTGAAMGGVSEFALRAQALAWHLTPPFSLVAFPAVTVFTVAYLTPIVREFGPRRTAPTPVFIERRIVSLPLVSALAGLTPWLVASVFFPGATYIAFGRWSPELLSSQVFSPLVGGFLASTTTYFLFDWIVRARIAPLVFPAGQLRAVPGALVLGVRARMLVFLVAVAFTPLFTMLGIVRATIDRIHAGMPIGDVIAVLAPASSLTFFLYLAGGVGLTLLVARGLASPLVDMSTALQRIRGGDLTASVRVVSADELGILGDGVNALVETLRERDHILSTFGHVVEPAVRDRLLAGDLTLGGELRVASALFCDLRGFTALAEQASPTSAVATLNAFFSTMTDWVRLCHGFVDKFIGDALFAVFGLFEDDPDGRIGAAAAVRCALGMRERLHALNRERQAAGQPALAIAVGVHTGEVVAGRIGAEDRHEYTVIGDTVNVAARLQELCKDLGRDLVVSTTTYERARGAGVAPAVGTAEVVRLRGRSEPVRVFALS